MGLVQVQLVNANGTSAFQNATGTNTWSATITNLAPGSNTINAIAFDTSYNPGQSNWAFEQFDNAQAEVIAINVNAFNLAIKDGLHELDGWSVIPAAAGLAVLALLLLGLRGRVAEYRMPISESAPAGTPLPTATEEAG